LKGENYEEKQMIRDRNIAPGAAIDPSKIAGGFGVMGPHRIHYVYKSTDSYIKSYLQQRVDDANLHTTITDAVAAATNHDTIAVYPGQYIETATLAITQENLRLIAVHQGPWGALSRTEIRATTAHDIISANSAHGFELAGFRLTFYGSNTYAAVRLASSATQYNTWIHNCNLYALSPGDGQAIVCGIDGSHATDTTYITDNTFWKGGDKQIDLGQGMRTSIRNNQFTQIGSTGKYGIYCPAMTTGVRNSFILDNKFFNAEGGACYGIYDNANVAVGDLMIDGNHFVGYSDADHCIRSSLDAQCEGANYHNHTLIAT